LNAIGSLRRTFFLALLVFVVVIIYTAWSTITRVFLEQSRLQQESISPVFSLIVDELIQPLHIAETTFKSGEFVPFLNAEQPDEAKLVATLKKHEEAFDLVFFAASEKVRKQYFSSGRQIDLVEGEVDWYFQALADERDFLADLGDVDNVHLFFDFKVYDETNELLGIVGIGKSMQHFLAEFTRFKEQHGYDFLFVNEKDQILLSSRAELLTAEGDLIELNSLPWFETAKPAEKNSLNGIMIEENNESFLLSEVKLQSLNWRVILLLPMQSKQNRLNEIFINNFLMIFVAVLFFMAFVCALSRYLGHKIAKHVDIDHLSQLPNRRFVERRFSQFLDDEMQLSLVVLDIDHFKSINDNYGHNVGDVVIHKVSKILKDAVRTDDIAARWGGEEFILILPGATFDIAVDIAERLRQILSKSDLHIDNQTLHITASLGVTYSNGDQELLDLVEIADDLLYEAKRSGRNCVRAGLPSDEQSEAN
jgi:diguanylate cyclase (GGDEF)-like protein